MMVFAHLLSSLSIAASGTFLMCLESRTTQGDWLRARSAFRWVKRSRKFDRNGDDWEGEVVPAHDPGPSRARSRPARTWSPCWRRRGDPLARHS